MNKRQIKKYIKKVNNLLKNGTAMAVIYQFDGKRDEYGIPHYFEIRKIPIIKYIK